MQDASQVNDINPKAGRDLLAIGIHMCLAVESLCVSYHPSDYHLTSQLHLSAVKRTPQSVDINVSFTRWSHLAIAS